MEHNEHEPYSPGALPRLCSTPHSAPVAWLRACPEPVEGSDPPPPPVSVTDAADPVRAAIELVLASPEAVAEVVSRADPTAFASTERSRSACPEQGRRDGWTGERMATFLEVLADTGIVSEACRAAGMSREGVYPLRNRDPVFAAAWRAAQAKARPVIADGLLERSITGTVEHYYRDGVLVGERRHYESWLGLAVLKRLDKQAEEDRSGTALSSRMESDWNATLDALRSGGTAAVPAALEPEVDEVDTPPPPGSDPWDNLWQTDDGRWMTTFPPPAGFDGHESGSWDGFDYYERACTTEEAELIEAHQAAMEAQERAELTAYAEAERDAWFAKLRAECSEATGSIAP